MLDAGRLRGGARVDVNSGELLEADGAVLEVGLIVEGCIDHLELGDVVGLAAHLEGLGGVQYDGEGDLLIAVSFVVGDVDERDVVLGIFHGLPGKILLLLNEIDI